MSKAAAWDMFSNLPDSLLHHIHSFLESKDGARTSVLSKRLNYIWTTVPTLDFHFQMQIFCLDPNPSGTQKFVDFVDGTLRRRNSLNIDKFVLGCYEPLSDSRVHSWISKVIRGNVKELSLNLYRNHPLLIPLSLFTCESLISLELYCPNLTLPENISFPRLKRLKLKGFRFSDECWNEELFSNSPFLEELTLQSCRYHMRKFCILVPTLKILTIEAWYGGENDLQDCVFKINAPELVSFSYTGYAAKEFALSSFQALVEATVYFHFQEYVGAKNQLLGALAHVKRLAVCDRTLQAICSANDLSNNLLTFQNVKRLSICDILNSDRGLIALLKAVPNLESLIFANYMNDELVEPSYEEDESDNDEDDSDNAEGDGDDDNEDHDADSVEGASNHEDEGDAAAAAECENNNDSENQRWELDILTTGCLFPHLKSVCFQQFAGNPREVKWARLILRDAKALQIMSIRHRGIFDGFANSKSEKELMVEIPSFPRASPGCVINFCSGD